MKKKKLLWIAFSIFLIYGVWLGFNLFQFKTYSAGHSSSSLEVEGVYHIHSTFSDGRKTADEIVTIASSIPLDFIILTDHGNPNLESIAFNGWKRGVLVLSGSELSVSRGHLVALNFDTPQAPFLQNAEQAAWQVSALEGFSIIAHPYSKTQWSWGNLINYSGIEIINADTMLKKKVFATVPLIPALLIKPEYPLIRMLSRPEKNLRKWDELNSTHQIYGYYSTDAHTLYRALFRLLHLHLVLQSPLSNDSQEAISQVGEALQKGQFYSAVDAAAHAKGFRFWANKGNQSIPMGGNLRMDAPVSLHIKTPYPFSYETHIIHNGRTIVRSFEKNITYTVIHTGFYRVEVYLREKSPLRNDVPWILSNPIFIKEGIL